uniref:SET domain-containing protein n=1 Tax=Cuerna arida TaxID=1464854 RepID=A0A1B6GPU9_9HEMI
MGIEYEDNWCSPFLYETKSDECEICGKPHEIEKCDLLKCSIEQVKDTSTPSYARLTLPDGLEVKELLDGTTNVVTTKPFRKGIQFGPFIAKTSALMDVRIEFPIKVFLNEDDSVYLESYEELFCNWMCLVPPASNNQEQNLFCYQIGTSIYYCTIRDIEKGQELKVWYSPYYGEKMGVHSFSKPPDLIHSSDEEFQEIYSALQKDAEVQDHTYIPKLKNKRRRKLPKTPILGENYYRAIPPNDVLPGELLGAVERKGEWQCKECGQVETNVAAYARHLMEHYRNSTMKTLSCPYCSKRFRKDGYSRRIHIEICKEKQPHKELQQCSTNSNESGKSIDQSLHLEILATTEPEKNVTKTSKDNLEESLLSLENISSAILGEQNTDST